MAQCNEMACTFIIRKTHQIKTSRVYKVSITPTNTQHVNQNQVWWSYSMNEDQSNALE